MNRNTLAVGLWMAVGFAFASVSYGQSKTDTAEVPHASSGSSLLDDSKKASDNEEKGIKENIDKFALEGVRLGMTLSEYKTLFPGSSYEHEETDEGHDTVVISTDGPFSNIDHISVRFYKGKLFWMKALYKQKRIEDIGGSETLVAGIVKKFGKLDTLPQKSKSGLTERLCLFWEKPKYGFSLCLAIDDDGDCLVQVKSLAVEKEIEAAKRENANLGF